MKTEQEIEEIAKVILTMVSSTEKTTLIVPLLDNSLFIDSQLYPKSGTELRFLESSYTRGGKFSNGVLWRYEPVVAGLRLVPDPNDPSIWGAIGTDWEDFCTVLRKVDESLTKRQHEIVLVVDELLVPRIKFMLTTSTHYYHNRYTFKNGNIVFSYPDASDGVATRVVNKLLRLDI